MQVLWSESLQNASGDGLGPDGHITSFAFLPDLEALCVAAITGELLLVHTSREVQEASLCPPAVCGRPTTTMRAQSTWCMQIGKLEEGIACSAWSPDQEFLAICTRDRQLVLMNKVQHVLS